MWLDALGLHVGDQLVGDLGQHVLGQACHTQHVVARAVHVVPERHKLQHTWHKHFSQRLNINLNYFTEKAT